MPAGVPADETFVDSAIAPNDKIFAQVNSTVVRYRSDGGLDRSFGKSGAITIEAPSGTRFEPAGISADSMGRLVVAGTARDITGVMPGPSGGFSFPRRSALVIRYTPSGELDRSFGTDGSVVSTFDFEAPTFPTASEQFHYEAPIVGLTGVAVDSRDRPVLTGTDVTHMSGCGGMAFGSEQVTNGFIARLTKQGAPDSTFGRDTGRSSTNGLVAAYHPMVAPNDGVAYTGRQKADCRTSPPSAIGRLGSLGNPILSFGSNGWKTFARSGEEPIETSGSVMGLDPRGRILLRLKVNGSQIARLMPDGTLDPTFGHGGIARFELIESADISAIAADRRGRVLIGGLQTRGVCSGCYFGRGKRPISMMALSRMHSNGTVDRQFGHHGIVLTPFPGFGLRTKAGVQQILVDSRNRILLSGKLRSPHFASGVGLAFARYLSGD